jgi:hypothetical protein
MKVQEGEIVRRAGNFPDRAVNALGRRAYA